MHHVVRCALLVLLVLQTQDGQPAWGRVLYEDLFGPLYGWCTAAVGVEPALK